MHFSITVISMLFLIVLILPIQMSTSWSLNALEYANCVFHIFDSDSGNEPINNDIIEQIMWMNQLHQKWTVTKKLHSSAELSKSMPKFEIHDNKKTCAINILIAVKNNWCNLSDLDLGRIQSHLSFPNNLFLFIFGPKPLCRINTLLKSGTGIRILVDLYIIHLNRTLLKSYSVFRSADIIEPEFSYSVCGSCRRAVKVVFQIPLPSLHEMSQLSKNAKVNSVQPIILVFGDNSGRDFLGPDSRYYSVFYKHRKHATLPHKIGRVLPHIFMENVAARLNLTLKFIPMDLEYLTSYFIAKAPMDQAGIALMESFGWAEWGNEVAPASIIQITPFLRGSTTSRFFYCRKSEKRTSFCFSFWTIPFDEWSWLLLGISLFGLTIVARRHGFEVFAILMRQDCTILNNHKFLFFFILATIVITCAYESIISSFVTLPPPVLVFRTISDLLDNGYRIAGGVTASELEPLFKQEQISLDRIQASLHPTKADWVVAECNAAIVVVAHSGFLGIGPVHYVVLKHSKLYCHLVIESRIEMPVLDVFAGFAHRKMAATAQTMVESGMMEIYLARKIHLVNLPFNRPIALIKEEAEGRERPFNLSDKKIRSIFVGWAVLVGFDVIALITELIYNNITKGCGIRLILHCYNLINFCTALR